MCLSSGKSCGDLKYGERKWLTCETSSASVSTPAASSAELQDTGYFWEWVDEHYWTVQESHGYCDVTHLMADGNGFREMSPGNHRLIGAASEKKVCRWMETLEGVNVETAEDGSRRFRVKKAVRETEAMAEVPTWERIF